MEYLVPIALALFAAFYFFNRSSFSPLSKRVSKSRQNAELMKVLLGLDEESLDQLFGLYRQQFGASAARYARKTYIKWRAGAVRPNRETFRRFLLYLPKVMSFDLKCEILLEFQEAYCAKDHHKLTVFTDSWRESLTPLVQALIAKSANTELPAFLQERLRWLADDDMEIAQRILARSQARQSLHALSLLNEEFSNIEHLLDNIKARRKVTHVLRLPLGTVTLNIRRR
jgi:hypothetical protein